jgi:hypothetical protein
MGMKGFYFSMDALMAAMVLIAATAVLIGYRDQVDQKDPYQLSMLHTASLQETQDWNNSKNSNLTVLAHIYRNRNDCSDYFDNVSEKYALYFVNSTTREKICGNLEVSQKDLSSSQTLIPDVKVNSSFQGPKKAVMVMKN